MIEYECRFCAEDPFTGWRRVYDREEERYTSRFYEARLQVKPDKMYADLSTPAGIPALWSHETGGFWDMYVTPPAVGRVLTMEFDKGELLGTMGLNMSLLERFVDDAEKALNDAINSGLSVGVKFLDSPPATWEMGEGTREKPDKMTFGAVQIMEVSLTPLPRIKSAGILNRITPAMDDAAEGNDKPEGD